MFVSLALSVFGFQVYWTFFADDSNTSNFKYIIIKTCETDGPLQPNLGGWMLDRSGRCCRRSGRYRIKGRVRLAGYALERSKHLLGERGTPASNVGFTKNHQSRCAKREVLTKDKEHLKMSSKDVAHHY